MTTEEKQLLTTLVELLRLLTERLDYLENYIDEEVRQERT